MTLDEALGLLSQPAVIGGLATIVAAIIAVFGGSWAYRRQRNIDHDYELRNERRRVYQDFMVSLVTASRGDGTAHLRARLEAGLIGSTEVIKAIGDYNKYTDETGPETSNPRDPEVFTPLLANVLIKMREDVFDKSELDPEQYGKLLPFK